VKVIYSLQARDDLHSILDMINLESPQGSARVAGRIENTVRLLSHFPGAGAPFLKRVRVRRISIGKYPYSMFYRVEDETVVILHIRHDKRRSPKLVELS
jgi:toxin ParE1/3/4